MAGHLVLHEVDGRRGVRVSLVVWPHRTLGSSVYDAMRPTRISTLATIF
jgi:hypothetical protein